MTSYQKYLSSTAVHEAREEIYSALKNDDLSEVVIVALRYVTRTPLNTDNMKVKSNEIACRVINIANMFKNMSMNKQALQHYNIALTYACKNATMKPLIARTRFLLKIRALAYCLKDVQLCKTLPNDDETANELTQSEISLKEELRMSSIEKEPSDFVKEFFNLKGERLNSHVPCATARVNVAIESGKPVIKAGKNIPIGTVVALEKPFVSQVDERCRYVSCYHCHLMTPNLLPCDDCCCALFCSDRCKRLAIKEYHQFECKVSDIIDYFEFGTCVKLIVRAAIKMKLACETWSEFIEAADKINAQEDDVKINEIFDGNNKFSLLKCKSDTYFIHGKMFNASFMVAIIIYRLDVSGGFFPTGAAKDTAVRAFARVMMHLYIYPPRILGANNCADDVLMNTSSQNAQMNTGWFSFASRLQHSCNANLFAAGIGNKVALIAVHNIQKGTDLKISFLGHFYESLMEPRHRTVGMIKLLETLCQCRVCIQQWNYKTTMKRTLSAQDTACYEAWKKIMSSKASEEKKFQETCNALGRLYDAEMFLQHRKMFNHYRLILQKCQRHAIKNVGVGIAEDD